VSLVLFFPNPDRTENASMAQTPRQTQSPTAPTDSAIIDGANVDDRSAEPSPPKLVYPATHRGDVTDQYHGVTLADPYRWLEDAESDATAAWVKAQNEKTRAYLDTIAQRPQLVNRLTELWNYERFGIPERRGETYFFTHNDGLQNQNVLYKTRSLDAPREILLDPNTLSQDGTVALSSWAPTRDGKLIAYSLADGGSDWRTIRVREVATGNELGDEIRWVKFSPIAWLPDASGFFYCRYDAPQPGQELSGTNYFQKLYFHRLGQPQSDDTLIYKRDDEKEWGFSPIVSEDGSLLVISNWRSTERVSQIFVKDLADPNSSVRPLITGFDAEYDFVERQGDELFFLTDSDAPRRRLIAVNVNDGSSRREVIATGDDVLESVSLFGDRFFANHLKDARSLVKLFSIDGMPIRELDLPGLGTASGFGGLRDADETFFTFTNYITPASVYRLDLKTDEVTLWRQPEVAIDVDAYQTEQIFFESRDGTKVPMVITRHRDTKLDGNNRTLLYGYGGFDISLTPTFSPAVAGWLDSGGIYAVANLRGGGEYGRQWHESGMLFNKQNVFDDFIAAAETLIKLGYTTPQRLAIRGGSNGGLLVGAVMTQRPDLFGACLPAVGVLDMLRFHKFTIGWAWVGEYGSSDDAKQFEYLMTYSPLHRLKPGTCYPATLITTADSDDRVVPAHSFKFAAALQHAQGCDAPTLIRIETRAGHGAGTPVIDEYADLWAFLIDNLPLR
jgi:prolyl oligopeptidase